LKILVILGSGGHTAQMLKLVDLLGDRFEYVYLVGRGDNLSVEKIVKKGEICLVHRARDHGDNVIVTFFKVIRLFLESQGVIRRTKPEVILSAGPGIAVPISMLGKIFGKKIIFVESWSRVYKGSTSGKIMYRFADLFFVQWPEMKSVYSRGIYAGRLQ
jgi:beta-1,4-N-acetylglucosaminyltransferase